MVYEHGLSLSDFVGALYRALLLREPDEGGSGDKTSRLVAGELSPSELITEFMSSEEFSDRVAEIMRRTGLHKRLRFTSDVSQYGEVLEVLRLIVDACSVTKFVVDVGARGRDRSNSYDFMREFGWTGLLIEANPLLLDSIHREFTDLNYRLVCCAVSDYVGRGALTIGSNDDVSSLSEHLAVLWGESKGEVEVRVDRLPNILSEQGVPLDFDLLSIDIEGEDIKVLNDLIDSSDYRPRWIIVEASDNFRVATLDQASFSQEVKAAYDLRARTRSNLILGLKSAGPV